MDELCSGALAGISIEQGYGKACSAGAALLQRDGEKEGEEGKEIGRDRGVIEIATPERKLLLSDAVARRVVVASHALRELTLGPDGIAGTECLVRHTVGF